MTRIGLLTSGGDAPGMNAAIVGAIQRAQELNIELVLISGGYAGLAARSMVDEPHTVAMERFHLAGTWLGTSRWAPLCKPTGVHELVAAVADIGLDALIIVGGAGSLAGAGALHRAGVRVVGVPATIDNDLNDCEVTLGADSAINHGVRAIDDVRMTATALPHRAFIVETLGGECGNLARAVAAAANLDLVITPENPVAVDHVIEQLPVRIAEGYGIVVLGEGAGPAQTVADRIGAAIGQRVRVTVLGHGQRAAPPTAFDRLLGLTSGRAAAELALTNPGMVLCQHHSGTVTPRPIHDWDPDHDRDAD